MIFSVQDRLFDAFPDLHVGVLVAKVENTRYGEDILESVLDRIRDTFKDSDHRTDPRVLAWRQAFHRLRMPTDSFVSSTEYLLSRALKGGVFPRVNPIVDLYTAVSLEYLIPVGGHDITCIEGNMALGFAAGNEHFTPIEGGEEEFVPKDEVIYRDDGGALTRGWVYKQSNKDRVSADTKAVFIPVDLLDPRLWPSISTILDRIQDYLHANGCGRVIYRATVSKGSPTLEFAI
jgi:DNA/RNA-binding domain of Phe-tRNA-synthetase-like protein